jgi:hypothetical protein
MNVSPQPIFIRLPSIPVLSNANYKKAVLSNTNNTARLTKNQRYSQLVKNNTYKKTWATQSQTYTNSNTNNLPKVGNSLGCTVSIFA